MGTDILCETARQCFTEKMTLEQRPENNEGVSPADIWKQRIPNRGNSTCKCPEVGAIYGIFKKSQKVGMAGQKGAKKIAVGDKIKKMTAGQLAGAGEPL